MGIITYSRLVKPSVPSIKKAIYRHLHINIRINPFQSNIPFLYFHHSLKTQSVIIDFWQGHTYTSVATFIKSDIIKLFLVKHSRSLQQTVYNFFVLIKRIHDLYQQHLDIEVTPYIKLVERNWLYF